MKSRAAPRFWKADDELPPEIRGAAQKAYRLFRQNPRHPSLQFKKIHASEPVYSVRVTGGYRANDQVTWIWIGSHAEYNRLLNSL